MAHADRIPEVVLLILRALAATATMLVALAAALPAAAATPTPTTSAPVTQGLAYVALGDSYAAGYGLPDQTHEPDSGCAQSSHDYPHRVAERLGLDLTDVSCAGATTDNIVDTKQYAAQPQADALGTGTQVVTVSIGGNDGALFNTSASCIALSRTGPIFGASASTRSCKQVLDKGGNDQLTDILDTTTKKGLRQAFAAITAKAPNARVFVIGYPALFPNAANTPAEGCFRPVFGSDSLTGDFPTNGFPFTDTDVKYIAKVSAHLDDIIEEAAKRAGFTYVDTLPDSETHSGCATSQPYVQGISLQTSDGVSKVTVQEGALHPNDLGTAYVADRTAAALKTSFEASPPGATPAASGAAGSDLLSIVLAAVIVVLVLVILLVVRQRSRARARRDDPTR